VSWSTRSAASFYTGREIGRGFRKAWETGYTDAGFLGRILHDVRRSAVRNMERKGLSRSVAMQLTGTLSQCIVATRSRPRRIRGKAFRALTAPSLWL
jgi:hypothetical protein